MLWGLSGHVCLLLFLYFIQGLPYGIQTHFLPVYLRTRGVNLTDISLFRLLQIPWLFKVVWAPFIDSYSTHRRWLLVSILAMAITCIGSAVNSPDDLNPLAVITLFLCNIFASMQDVSVDAIALSLLSGDQLAAGNVAQIVGYKLGAAFAGGILALLVNVIGWSGMSFTMAAIYGEAAMLVYVSPMLRNSSSFNHNPVVDVSDHQKNYGICQCKKDSNVVTDERCRHHTRCRQVLSNSIGNLGKNHLENCHECSGEKVNIKSSEPHALLQVMTVVVRHVFSKSGTLWLLIFLFIYKLGEQGALSMMPMFLLDHQVDSTELTFWTAVVGQVVSICGSLSGGWFVTTFSHMPVQFTLQQVCLLRLLPIGIHLLLIVIWNTEILGTSMLLYTAVFSLMLLTFLSGVVTTITFTLMMKYTQGVSADLQATYYTSLATVEVIGKLLFTSSCGWLASIAGYHLVFLLFVILSAMVLLWLRRCPKEIANGTTSVILSEEIDG